MELKEIAVVRRACIAISDVRTDAGAGEANQVERLNFLRDQISGMLGIVDVEPDLRSDSDIADENVELRGRIDALCKANGSIGAEHAEQIIAIAELHKIVYDVRAEYTELQETLAETREELANTTEGRDAQVQELADENVRSDEPQQDELNVDEVNDVVSQFANDVMEGKDGVEAG